MEVSGQLYAQAALPPRHHGWSECGGEEKNIAVPIRNRSR